MAAFSDPRSRWAGAVLLLVAAGAALSAWADTRPSYDAYGWLTWGHMTLHGGLDTNAAPSWKPLPYMFTVVYGLFGSGAAMWLWMGTATGVALAGLVVAGRLAYRLSLGDGAGPRWAGWVAAGLAAAALLALHDEFPFGYLHYALSAQSDPMLVTFVLSALDCELCGRRRCAFGLLWLAALGRPEAWPLLVLDGAWLWRRTAGFRWVIGGGVVAAGLLWFGIPALSSRSWWVAAENAHDSGFGPTGNRILGVLGRFIAQAPWPLQLGGLAMAAVGLWRRERAVLLLLAGIVVWMVVEVGFGLHGWPALGRYMFEPSAGVVVLGAGFVGRSLAGEAQPRVAGPVAAAAVVAAAVAVVAGTIPFLVAQGRAARADLVAQQARTAQFDALGAVIDRLGGAARIRGCGEAIADNDLAIQTLLAYDIEENVNQIGYKLPQPGHPHNPIVVFTPLRDGGWRVQARRQTRPRCRALARG